MERAGARARHRAPACYDPGKEYFWGGVLLAATFGLTMGAVNDCWDNHDYGWMWFLSGMAVIDVILYFWIMRCWLHWID